MNKLKKLLIIILMVTSMIILSMLLMSRDSNARRNEGTLEDFLAVNPVGYYKYVFDYSSLYNWDNLNCIRKGAQLGCHSITTNNEKHLHKLTTYVEINGNNAKFYARRWSFYFARRDFNIRVKL